MREKLEQLLNNAYAPITNFKVAAIVVTKDNKEFYGVNVEDASLRAGTCAERNAIYNAITNGYKKGDFKEIHLMFSSKEIGTPCFVCRQLISELFDKESKIYSYSDNEIKEYTVNELCPYPFGEGDIK